MTYLEPLIHLSRWVLVGPRYMKIVMLIILLKADENV